MTDLNVAPHYDLKMLKAHYDDLKQGINVPSDEPGDDANIQALLDAGTPVCTVVGKTWSLHVTDVLRTTLEENLARLARESPGVRD